MKNTFKQFDQFEVLNISNVKNKHLFDFSHSSINENSTNSSLWMIKDKINRTTNMTTTIGDTGSRPIIFGDPTSNNNYGPIYTATGGGPVIQGQVLTSDYVLTGDNSGEKLTPHLSENTLVYLGELASENILPVFYRSGYIEISFRTEKQNCIIGYGSSIIDYSGTDIVSLAKTIEDAELGNIYSNTYTSDSELSQVNELTLNIKDGKFNLSYKDLYGINSKSFEINSNVAVADNQWHHVIVNFGRPGLVKDHSSQSEERTIEIWIDGKLDIKTSDYINDDQIFFPEMLWLGANPNKLFNSQLSDLFYGGFNFQDENLLANNTITTNVWNGVWPAEAVTDAFHGGLRTFAHGLNFPLNKFEIQERYKFWNYDELPFRDSMDASSVFATPQISVNKKRALKLFWNNIESKNGIELDNNFIVDAYSITHKNRNSITETYNLDLAKKKDFTILEDVRVALRDNVLLWGPAVVSPQNKQLASEITREGILQGNPNRISEYSGFDGFLANMTFSGIELNNGDRVLLTNQINKTENGIWIFNGKSNAMTRANDADSPTKINNAIVYVTEGKYAETYWTLESNISSFNDGQTWTKLNEKPSTTIYSQPFLTKRWHDIRGNERFIDLENDLSIGNYDLIVFMNYPDDLSEIKEMFPQDNVTNLYKEFVESIKNVVIGGANLYVSSPMLALDLGIVRKFTEIPQLTETSDAQSASINPFQPGEPAERYFDTHRNNQYQLATEIPGLTDKETYILTDFINYIPEDIYEYEQYHAKYAQKPTGLKEGNNWFIPGFALTQFTENENLPGNRDNYRGTKPFLGVDTSFDILSGTMVTKLANNYYNGSTVINNPYDDYATTIAILPGQTLDGIAITGKVFVNCVEDGYTFSREDYNKAMIQVVPTPDINESTNTRLWQYSTNRLNRSPRKNNTRQLTENGQTVPTNGGGGGFIQSASNASNGIIRSESDKLSEDYQSDFYPSLEEEIYSLQEIPVLSMTWLGLQWLAE